MTDEQRSQTGWIGVPKREVISARALKGNRIHLLGICGTAMASMAGLLRAKGYRVTGSDENVYPPMSEMLVELGIEPRSPYRPENVPDDTDLVVVGNAVSRGNPELEAVLDRRLPYASMPEVLKELFLRERLPVVIAGTHGKTTTTALVSWLLRFGGRDPGFLVGGIPGNFETSFHLGQGEPFVVEGDEYDTAYFDKGPKFLHYLPEIVVLGNVEYDHADIYDDLEAVKRAFRLLVNIVPRVGLLIVGKESELACELAREAFCLVETFAESETATADWQARIDSSGAEGTRFDILLRGKLFASVEGPYWGRAGLLNALASCAVGHRVGISAEAIRKGLEGFRGVRRRLEVRGLRSGVTVVDDFAHHPTAVRETIRSAGQRWGGCRLWAVFEPRSFTARSNVFQEEFAEALALADEVVIASVFSSKRLPTERELSEEKLVASLSRRNVSAAFIPEPLSIVEHLSAQARDGDVVLVMSNGAFGGIHEKLLNALKERESQQGERR